MKWSLVQRITQVLTLMRTSQNHTFVGDSRDYLQITWVKLTYLKAWFRSLPLCLIIFSEHGVISVCHDFKPDHDWIQFIDLLLATLNTRLLRGYIVNKKNFPFFYWNELERVNLSNQRQYPLFTITLYSGQFWNVFRLVLLVTCSKLTRFELQPLWVTCCWSILLYINYRLFSSCFWALVLFYWELFSVNAWN